MTDLPPWAKWLFNFVMFAGALAIKATQSDPNLQHVGDIMLGVGAGQHLPSPWDTRIERGPG